MEKAQKLDENDTVCTPRTVNTRQLTCGCLGWKIWQQPEPNVGVPMLTVSYPCRHVPVRTCHLYTVGCLEHTNSMYFNILMINATTHYMIKTMRRSGSHPISSFTDLLRGSVYDQDGGPLTSGPRVLERFGGERIRIEFVLGHLQVPAAEENGSRMGEGEG